MYVFPGYYDLSLDMPALPYKDVEPEHMSTIVGLLDVAAGGKVKQINEIYYFEDYDKNLIEIPTLSSGKIKFALLAHLLRNRSIDNKTTLFLDSPEADLGPGLLKVLARSVLMLSAWGTQVIMATHSLFLLREIEVLKQGRLNSAKTKFFSIRTANVPYSSLTQSTELEHLGAISVLDENLLQADRFLYQG